MIKTKKKLELRQKKVLEGVPEYQDTDMESSICLDDQRDLVKELEDQYQAEDNEAMGARRKILDNDLISQNFRCKLRRVISYTGSDGKNRSIEKVVDNFAAIMVNVIGFKDVFNAWEEQVETTIDDFKEDLSITSQSSVVAYRAAENQHVKAFQAEYFEQVPKVLCLQLNRLEFTGKEPIKHKHRVEIEKQISIDRFMHEN